VGVDVTAWLQLIFTLQTRLPYQFYERLAFWQAADASPCRRTPLQWALHGKDDGALQHRRALPDQADDVDCPIGESTVGNATGTTLYNSCITNHRLTADNVCGCRTTGGATMEIENETNTVLKTKAYHLEHNLGHGSSISRRFRLSLNLLAFLFHTVFRVERCQYALLASGACPALDVFP